MSRRIISNPSVSWLQDHGTPNEKFIGSYFDERLRMLAHAQTVPTQVEMERNPSVEIETLKPYYGAIAKVVAEVANQALNRNTVEGDEMPTRRVVRERLLEVEKALPKELHAKIPELSDVQTGLVQEMFSAWRFRVLHYTAHLDRESTRGRT